MSKKDGRQDSLGASFTHAQKELHAINNSTNASNSQEYQKQTKDLVVLLRSCLNQIQQLSLFSSNETPDDYSTSELKLILVNVYLGEALQKLHAPGSRVAVLEEALSQYRSFLTNCYMIGMFKPSNDSEKKLVSQPTAIANQSSEIKTRANSSNPVAAGQSRMDKIARFKQMRTMQQSIADLEAKFSAAADKNNSDEDMDEVERDHAIKLIELKIYQVVDDMGIISDEMIMAKRMEETRQNVGGSDSRMQAYAGASTSTEIQADDWKLDSSSYRQIDPRTGQPIRPIFNGKGQPMQPFVLTNDRQRIKDGVFRPSWALPTMTVDEYLQQEKERGNIISGGGKEPDEKPEINDNDHEALDAETMKQRDWDDFKDDNPKGWGNRGGNRG
ncbi:Type 2A phosphatase-associated protein 42 [Coemansia spiralis]|uniref:Type 2A phosphatase-associated protein 42 n=2 Tax=Coemansia TaxID=4863 RepID=A0A9W8GD74_9FUNG|nr:Type 2A phosphatase-associated protein 42 [Coemansia umbellata]KAJ2625874.1 Type 2A phosphatase-associated protein 42 [Coemansia sp. RSA 1358]KAJ2680997.1 Type 2A phosphatase-associated protein 42 [Coemansia spiralis]